jgi:hypothetical protein
MVTCQMYMKNSFRGKNDVHKKKENCFSADVPLF